jgi:hypothetical protein
MKLDLPKRLVLDDEFVAECRVYFPEFYAGDIYYVRYNKFGGSVSTPTGRFFIWQPRYSDGYNKHWRIDCYLRIHELTGDPKQIGEQLVRALVAEKLCAEPIALQTHVSEEVFGRDYGEVFDSD